VAPFARRVSDALAWGLTWEARRDLPGRLVCRRFVGKAWLGATTPLEEHPTRQRPLGKAKT
jgi:hypothetical protein